MIKDIIIFLLWFPLSIFLMVSIIRCKKINLLQKLMYYPILLFSFLDCTIVALLLHMLNYDKTITIFSLIIVIIKTILTISAGKKILNRKLHNAQILYLVIILLITSSRVFGEYYFIQYFLKHKLDSNMENDWLNLPRNGSNILEQYINIFLLYFFYSKVGIRYYYEFPSYNMIDVVSVFQYFLGKIIDITIIGSFAAYIINSMNKKKVVIRKIKSEFRR